MTTPSTSLMAGLEAASGTQLAANPGERLKTLSDYLDGLRQLRARIVQGEALLAELKRDEKNLSETVIPAAMDELNLSKVAARDGTEFSVQPYVSASLAEGRMADALAWLREIGHDELILTVVVTEFVKGQDAQARALQEELALRELAASLKSTVNTSTFKAFVRELDEHASEQDAVPVPYERLGIYKGRKTVLVEPKKPRVKKGA